MDHVHLYIEIKHVQTCEKRKEQITKVSHALLIQPFHRKRGENMCLYANRYVYPLKRYTSLKARRLDVGFYVNRYVISMLRFYLLTLNGHTSETLEWCRLNS